MKSSVLSIVSLALLTAVLVTFCAPARIQETPDRTIKPLTGTWELKMYKYGYGATAFQKYPKGRRQIQMITDDYFTWVRLDSATKKIYGSATGRYTYDGNNFVVNVDYGLGMDSYLGVQSNYTVRVEDDLYFLSGELVEGFMIEEIWERIH